MRARVVAFALALVACKGNHHSKLTQAEDAGQGSGSGVDPAELAAQFDKKCPRVQLK